MAARSTRRLYARAKFQNSIEPVIETLERRTLLSNSIIAPTVASGFAINDTISIPAGGSTVIPINDADTANVPLNYQLSSNNPDFAVSQITGGTFVDMQVSDGVAGGVNGDLVFQLFNTLTPNTAAYITSLVQQGFYNNIIFHRIVSSFVAQAGDPTGTGTYAPYNFPDEFSQSLIYSGNGQLGMARTSDNDTDSTQFFITDGDQQAALNYKYTLFGQLISGFSTFDQIMQLPTGASPANPTVTIESARVIQDNTDTAILVTAAAGTPTGASGIITVTTNDGNGNSSPPLQFAVTGEVDTMASQDNPPFFTDNQASSVGYDYTVAENGTLNIPLVNSAVDFYNGNDTFDATLTSNGTATVSNETLTITPSSSYTGVLSVTLSVSRNGDSADSSPDTRTLTIGVLPSTSTALAAVTTTATDTVGSNGTINVATFSGTDPLSAYTATLNWGTGQPTTTGTVAAGGGNQIIISGAPSTVYANPGTYTGIATVTDSTSGQTLTFNDTITVPATVEPVYNLYCAALQDHLLTADANEYNVLSNSPGWSAEGIAFYAYNGLTTLDSVEDAPVYRLYDTLDGQHLFTADLNEYNTLRVSFGWVNEGVAFYEFLTNPTSGGVAAAVPLYRLDYPYIANSPHLFTTDTNELGILTSQYGWIQEGIAGYVLSSP